MVFLPLVPLLLLVLGLLSIVLLGGGLFILGSLIAGTLTGAGFLVAGLAMTLFSIAGRPLVLLLLRRPGPDEPEADRTGQVQEVTSPDGTRLHVEIYGPPDGQPLVFTHGWGTNSTSWYYAKRALGDRFRLIMWDLPGLGESGKPPDDDYDLEKLAHDLAAVLALAGDRPAILVGHSIGGMIQLTFCRLFPDMLGRQVAGLVEVHTTYTDPVRTAAFRGFLTAVKTPLLRPLMYLTIALFPVIWAMNWLSYFNGTAHIGSMLVGFAGHETRGQLDYATRFTPLASPAVLARGMLAMFHFEETPTLPTIPVPVLILAGEVDRITIKEASAQMLAAIPGAEMEILDSGHMGIFEQHQDFVRALTTFAERCAAAQTGVTAITLPASVNARARV
jgi:pimeloyl-ACP methyl ester carboxylesterase